MKELIDKLERENFLSDNEFLTLLDSCYEKEYLFSRARAVRERHYGKKIYLRGLIEFTNYCKNNCYYCGIRRENLNICRYRLDKAQILDVCRKGYATGFRTFVLQGGDDSFFKDEKICDILLAIKNEMPDCAITLSIGEKNAESYKKFLAAGADRYLLRHETADPEHYKKLHPLEISPDFPVLSNDCGLENRINCLYTIKKAGFQTGAGFMVGSPFQSLQNAIEDLKLLYDLRPHMVGIGPFIPHKDTPFANHKPGSAELTLMLLACIRLILPKVLLPSTTALGSLGSEYRLKGLLAGANVLMPNLTPAAVRNDYQLYDNKTADGLEELKKQIKRTGYYIDFSKGDAVS